MAVARRHGKRIRLADAVILTGGGGGASFSLDDISSTQGAILYRNATEWVALLPGSAGELLTTGGAGANPAWDAPAPFDLDAALDDLFGVTHGTVIYRDAAGWAALTPGTNGHMLTTHGGGADPTWTDPAAAPGALNLGVSLQLSRGFFRR